MNKAELLNWLQAKYQKWKSYLDQIDPERMDQPGVNGDWSMKDIVAHLTGWQRTLNARLRAAGRGEPEPAPYWPAQLQTEDEINAWIYETSREKAVDEVLDESEQVFQQLLAVIAELPGDVRIEQVEPAFQLVWVGNQRFLVSEFFDHFRDDHEPDVRAWLRQTENQDVKPDTTL